MRIPPDLKTVASAAPRVVPTLFRGPPCRLCAGQRRIRVTGRYWECFLCASQFSRLAGLGAA